MKFFKEHAKELVAILLIVLICGGLLYLSDVLLKKQDEYVIEREIAQNRYNTIASGETSVEILNEELEEIVTEKERLAAKLKEDYRIQDANLDLIEIIKTTDFIDIENCTVTEPEVDEGATYKRVEVRVKSFYGHYSQIKDFMEFLNEFSTKVTIDSMEFERDKATNSMNGRTLVFTLYGLA